MLGAVIGDIVGSIYEWNNIKTKDFPLFRDNCFFTDDTVMTCAVAEALMAGGREDDFIDAMKAYGRRYPHAGYGSRFGAWLAGDDRKPYGSWGNGSAMRVSPVGFWVPLTHDLTADACSLDIMAARSAAVTHDHPEGIRGAQATAGSILFWRYRRRKGLDPAGEMAAYRHMIETRFGYDLSRTLDELRPSYRFNESCQETVPQAITAVLESHDFEDAIRNAISLGGDSDTLAAITGGIAEAVYGIPDSIRDKALTYLDEPLLAVYRRWYAQLPNPAASTAG